MNYRFLGSSGVKVSEICFGTMTFGGSGYWKVIGEQGQKEADQLVGFALNAGINFFDSADIYSEGLSEQILGKALGTHRKDIILATKVRGRMGKGPNDVGLSRHHILEGCHASLRRLDTDYIDLYQLHNWDHRTPIDETLRALDDLIRSGKVRYIGCSNFSGWHLMKALATSDRLLLEKVITIQSYYSLVGRELEYELVPLALDQGIGILPWSPLAGGFLSGKYRRGMPRPEGARRSNPEGNFLQFDEERGFDIVEELVRVASSHHASVTQAALNYLLRKPAISSIITGARTQEHLADIVRTSDWELSPEEVKRLDDLSTPPRIYPYWMHEFSRGER